MVETASPERVGISANRLKDLHAAMQAFVDDGKYAGVATLIARRGQIVDSRCYGMLDLAANKALQPDSLFRIYSLTKPITSVAVLMLYDEGRFNLDNPVTQWIPEFRNLKVWPANTSAGQELRTLEKEITFRHLLTHTSGLAYGFSDHPIDEMYRAANLLSGILALQMPLSELVKTIGGLLLFAQPGTEFHYSVAHDVLGFLIGLISGQPLDVFLRERIFEPLGMPDTGFYVPPDKQDRFGPMYRARGEEPALTVADEVAGSTFVSPDVVPSGGAGLVSSMPDYLRFATMLANGGELDGVRLLSQSTFAALTTNQLATSVFAEGEFVGCDGLGLGVGVRVSADPVAGLPANAFGWGGASGTRAWVFPNEEMIVIYLVQSLLTLRRVTHLSKLPMTRL